MLQDSSPERCFILLHGSSPEGCFLSACLAAGPLKYYAVITENGIIYIYGVCEKHKDNWKNQVSFVMLCTDKEPLVINLPKIMTVEEVKRLLLLV